MSGTIEHPPKRLKGERFVRVARAVMSYRDVVKLTSRNHCLVPSRADHATKGSRFPQTPMVAVWGKSGTVCGTVSIPRLV
jgi:hypothetical protein